MRIVTRLIMLFFVVFAMSILFANRFVSLTFAHPSLDSGLLENGDFESNSLTSWTQCGNVRVVDRPTGGMASFADNNHKAVAFLNSGGDLSCPYYFVDVYKMWQPITIPADAETLVVKFWHYVDHVRPEKGGEYPDVSIFLSQTPTQADFNLISLGAQRHATTSNQ